MKEEKNHRKALSENIQRLLKKKGKTQTDMARELGFAQATVSSWLNEERYPRIDRVQQMADYFGVYRSDVTGNGNKNLITSSSYTYMPTSISAGLPIGVDGITDAGTIAIPDVLMGKHAGDANVIITKIYGDSMDKIMPDGSLVAIKPTTLDNLKDGDIVVFSNDHDYSVKHYHKHNDSLVFKPNSNNNVHYDQVYNTNDNITIHGKVVMWTVTRD